MSKRTRPTEVYISAAATLATSGGKPQYAKYIGRTDLTPQEKAAIARAKKWGRKPRTIEQYIESAKALSKFAPALKKYRKRKTLKNSEKAAIARKENVLRYSHNLHPVTKKQARKLKDKLYAPGVQAIELRNTTADARIEFVKDDMFLTVNGRTWLYWQVDRFDTEGMAEAANIAFGDIREAFPIERIAQLAERAFARPKTKEVYLWATSGRVGEGFLDLESFMEWLAESYGGYNEPDKWIRGLAIRL